VLSPSSREALVALGRLGEGLRQSGTATTSLGWLHIQNASAQEITEPDIDIKRGAKRVYLVLNQGHGEGPEVLIITARIADESV